VLVFCLFEGYLTVLINIFLLCVKSFILTKMFKGTVIMLI